MRSNHVLGSADLRLDENRIQIKCPIASALEYRRMFAHPQTARTTQQLLRRVGSPPCRPKSDRPPIHRQREHAIVRPRATVNPDSRSVELERRSRVASRRRVEGVS